jgi:leader peptidase (prepilin peptidase)/N-methyltransferase
MRGAVVFGAVALAPVLGSFLALLTVRLPEGRPVVFGRSVCDDCGHVLGSRDLIPLLSYAARSGRCCFCAQAIQPVHLFVELAAIAVPLWAAMVTSGWVFAATCLFGWLLLTLAAIDWRVFLLPNGLVAALAVGGFASAAVLDPAQLDRYVLGAAAGYAALVALGVVYRRFRKRDGIGAGDAKLLGAIGAWVALDGVATVVLLGASLALGYVLISAIGRRKFDSQTKLPFGSFLCAGAWLVWLYGPIQFR